MSISPQHQGGNTGKNKQHMKMYATSVIYDTIYSKMNFGRFVGVEIGGGGGGGMIHTV